MMGMVKLREQYVGKRIAWVDAQGVEFWHRCIDVSDPWGRVRLLLEPEAGTGTQWRDAKKCRVMEDVSCTS